MIAQKSIKIEDMVAQKSIKIHDMLKCNQGKCLSYLKVTIICNFQHSNAYHHALTDVN